MRSSVAVADIGARHRIVCFDVRNGLAARFTHYRAEIARGLAIGNTVVTVGMIVRRENESNGPIVVVVADAVGMGEESNLEITMLGNGTVLDQNTASVSHVSTARARILLIVIVILNHHTMARYGWIILGFFGIETVPHLAANIVAHERRIRSPLP